MPEKKINLLSASLVEFDYITNKPMYFIFTKLVPFYRKMIRNKSKKEIENEAKKTK